MPPGHETSLGPQRTVRPSDADGSCKAYSLDCSHVPEGLESALRAPSLDEAMSRLREFWRTHSLANADLRRLPADGLSSILLSDSGDQTFRNQEVGGSSPPRSTNPCSCLPARPAEVFRAG